MQGPDDLGYRWGSGGGSQHLGLMEGFPHRWNLLDWIAFDFRGATCWESGGMLQKKGLVEGAFCLSR